MVENGQLTKAEREQVLAQVMQYNYTNIFAFVWSYFEAINRAR